MTKINIVDPTPIKNFLDNLEYSPYYNVAWQYMERKGINDPSFVDLFEAFHEIAKVDNKINPKDK